MFLRSFVDTTIRVQVYSWQGTQAMDVWVWCTMEELRASKPTAPIRGWAYARIPDPLVLKEVILSFATSDDYYCLRLYLDKTLQTTRPNTMSCSRTLYDYLWNT